MTYYEDHSVKDLKGGWIMVLVVNLGLIILTL